MNCGIDLVCQFRHPASKVVSGEQGAQHQLGRVDGGVLGQHLQPALHSSKQTCRCPSVWVRKCKLCLESAVSEVLHEPPVALPRPVVQQVRHALHQPRLGILPAGEPCISAYKSKSLILLKHKRQTLPSRIVLKYLPSSVMTASVASPIPVPAEL